MTTPPATAPLTLTESAPAKVNLFLGVTPRVKGGKHQLTSVFATISLADTLTFVFSPASEFGGTWREGASRLHVTLAEAPEAPAGSITIETCFAPDIEAFDLPLEHNIIYKTVRALEQATGNVLEGQLHITLDKRIPAQGGLGGGSSDSAATIRALARFWGIDPTGAPCLEVARQMGSDVAFFLYGGCALMGGSGDVLLRRLPQPALDIVLAKPAAGVSTAAAYQVFDADPQPSPAVEPLIAALEEAGAAGEAKEAEKARVAGVAREAEEAGETGRAARVPTPTLLASLLANNLYPAALELLPELEHLLATLQAQPDVTRALLTGSGSTVFALCADAPAAAAAQATLLQNGYWAQTCTTLTSRYSNSTQLV